jgi:hypothetical protein
MPEHTKLTDASDEQLVAAASDYSREVKRNTQQSCLGLGGLARPVSVRGGGGLGEGSVSELALPNLFDEGLEAGG